MCNLLIIGPIPDLRMSETFGGTTISMQGFLEFLNRNQYCYNFIQTNKYFGRGKLVQNYLYTLTRLLMRIRISKVIMVNVSSRGTMLLWPTVFMVSRILNKKLVFRRFGGGIDLHIDSLPSLLRRPLLYSLKHASLLLIQTKSNINYLEEKGFHNVQWLPTVRKEWKNKDLDRPFNKKFVFISHVRPEKGIWEILKAVELLPKDYTFDIYGPIKDFRISSEDLRGSRTTYYGPLQPEEVESKLRNYDVLVLPSKYLNEGYPGILIESLSLGIPVIATKWRSIPEIINNENGILIEPNSYQALYNAILEFNENNISTYRRKAKDSFKSFNEQKVYSSLIKDIDLLKTS